MNVKIQLTKGIMPTVATFPVVSQTAIPSRKPAIISAKPSKLHMESLQAHGKAIPLHTGKDIGRGLAIRILKDAGFSSEDFMRLR